MTLLIQLPLSIPRDVRRYKEMKYGRRLKGPVMVTPKQFNKAVQGNGIGIKTDDCKDPLRIPRAAEDQHIEIIGDTGTGKTTLIMQLLREGNAGFTGNAGFRLSLSNPPPGRPLRPRGYESWSVDPELSHSPPGSACRCVDLILLSVPQKTIRIIETRQPRRFRLCTLCIMTGKDPQAPCGD
jgi:hypothetical protein